MPFFTFAAVIPIVWVTFLSIHITTHGTPGFSVTPIADSFIVATDQFSINKMKNGDRIKKIDGLEYGQVLGFLFQGGKIITDTYRVVFSRDNQTLTASIRFEPVTSAELAKKLWPNYLLITILVICALTAVLLSPLEQPAISFFIALIACAMIIASQIVYYFGQIHPLIISISFVVMTLGNWVMFSAWVHYCFNFPINRELLLGRPWSVTGIYLLPPVVSLAAAYLSSESTITFWGELQYYRRWNVPIYIFASYGKHIYDYFATPSKIIKNQLRIPLVATWVGLGPYVSLYLLPALLWEAPLITFRPVVLAGLSLPLAFLYVMIRYRLLEIDDTISNSLAYFILIITFYILFSVLLSFFNQMVGFETQYVIFPLSLIILFVFNPMRRRIQFIIDRLFFRQRFDRTELLQSFSRRLATVIKIEDLANLLTNDLRRAFKIEKMALEVINKGWRRSFVSEPSIEKTPRSLGPIQYFLENRRTDLSVYQSQVDSKLAVAMANIFEMGYVLILGLKSGHKLVGVLFLGVKENNRIYTEREVQVLKTLANQSALALENTLIYETLALSRKRIHTMYRKLIRSEKLANIGELASMLAHEIKNPLAIIRSSAQYLVSKPRDPETRQELLGYIVDEADTLNLVFSNMLGLSGYQKPSFTSFNAVGMIDELLKRWESSQDHRPGVVIRRNYRLSPVVIAADKKQLSQVVMNLVRNSEEAIEDDGIITVDIRRNESDNGISITIEDTGTGIAQENSAHLFRKFFTTKEKGLGLGLTLCRQIVEAHKGKLFVNNIAKGGAMARIDLPEGSESQPRPLVIKEK